MSLLIPAYNEEANIGVVLEDIAVQPWATEMGERLERVLTNDPGTGVMRHADAGYDLAIETAEREGIQIPMLGPRSRS